MLEFTSQRMNRRSFLNVGGLALGGVCLPDLLRAKEAIRKAGGVVKDKTVIFLFMHGGPSQFETFDPKMEAPAEIRSSTGEVKTTIPGVTFGGTFEKLAKRAHRLAVVRSYTTGNGNHDIKPIVGKDSLNANLGALYARIADTVDLDFLVVSGGYTLLETRALNRLLPLCVEREIGMIVAAPYASGWLATDDESMTYMYGSPAPAIVEKSRRMREICAEHDVPLASAALQFPLAHPAAAAVIPGAKSPEEARETNARLRTPVPEAVWAAFKSEGLIPEAAPTPD